MRIRVHTDDPQREDLALAIEAFLNEPRALAEILLGLPAADQTQEVPLAPLEAFARRNVLPPKGDEPSADAMRRVLHGEPCQVYRPPNDGSGRCATCGFEPGVHR